MKIENNEIPDSFGFMACPESDEEKDKLERFAEEVNEETVRGMVLNITSFIDELLVTVLHSYLPNVKKSKKLLYDDLDSCLGTLMNRANIAHSLSLITDNEFDWIKYIARIRNEFAHGWEKVSFESNEIKKLTNKLNHPNLNKYSATPRAKFMYIGGELVQHLFRRNEYARILREKLPDHELVGKISRMGPSRI